MSTPVGTPQRYAHLWEQRATPPRWVIWNTAEESLVFDRALNMPAPVDDSDLDDVVRRMRQAGAPESDEYPGRPCA
ncbi:hypothetical protein [Streptomyces sp. TRM49041]|uniref:hypothetical protein n=1 Tax=Streptomyces sp. TRM49041 TaxID=2603216 RepID=UPI0011ED0992|nr:hypothetical protein [Streptomyces sp. TRM49041]